MNNRNTMSQLVDRTRPVRDVIIETYAAWREDRTLRLGAGLAYYVLFTFVPFLALTAALAEPLFGAVDIQSFLSDRLAQFGMAAPESAGQSIVDELSRRSNQSTLGILGIGSLLFASSLVFMALVDAVNTIWNVPVVSGFRNSIRRRLMAFLMVLVTGFVIVADFAISAVSGAAEKLVPTDVVLVGTLSNLITTLASGLALVVALALLFRYTGPVRPSWLITVSASLATAALLVVGTSAISWYLRTFGGSSLTGAFGALLATLTWVYYEAQILLGGIQLVKVLTRRSDTTTAPTSPTEPDGP